SVLSDTAAGDGGRHGSAADAAVARGAGVRPTERTDTDRIARGRGSRPVPRRARRRSAAQLPRRRRRVALPPVSGSAEARRGDRRFGAPARRHGGVVGRRGNRSPAGAGGGRGTHPVTTAGAFAGRAVRPWR